MQNSELKSENLKEVYDKLAADWALKKPEETWGFEEIKKFIKLVGKGRVLDLGSAAGVHSKFLTDAGLEVVGIDISEKMIEEAKKKVPDAKFFVMDIQSLKFDDNYFGGIYARASLLHIQKTNIKKVLKNLYQILQPKGIIYIALKEGEGEKDVYDEYYKITRFISFFNEPEIRKLLEETGLESIEVSHFHEKNSYNELWMHIFAKKI